jgi:release factor glutamine methyltransferase
MEMTIQEIQARLVDQIALSSETAILDTQVLLGHFLQKPRSWILAHPEAPISKSQLASINLAVDQLTRGEPLPYVIGHWEFYGLDFQLSSDVLIPRPETELLVERGITWLKSHPSKRNAIDVGTGSGCIGISLMKNIPDLHVVLTDISLQALQIARSNAEKHGVSGRLEFRHTNLMEGIIGPFDVLCANLPYIPTALLMTLPVSKREPTLALDGGVSGTEFIGKLLDQGRSQLVSGGLMLLEIESSQGVEAKALAQGLYPLSEILIIKDLSGYDRCLEIKRPRQLVHICPREEWLMAQQRNIYQDEAFYQDGFIHCSQPEQVLDVANCFYRGCSDLVLMWLDPDVLVSDIQWEYIDGSMFPHVYGPINLEAVRSISALQPDNDGVFRTILLPA